MRSVLALSCAFWVALPIQSYATRCGEVFPNHRKGLLSGDVIVDTNVLIGIMDQKDRLDRQIVDLYEILVGHSVVESFHPHIAYSPVTMTEYFRGRVTRIFPEGAKRILRQIKDPKDLDLIRAALKQMEIGIAKGLGGTLEGEILGKWDREIVVDAFTAQTKGGGVPVFLTADSNIYRKLWNKVKEQHIDAPPKIPNYFRINLELNTGSIYSLVVVPVFSREHRTQVESILRFDPGRAIEFTVSVR